MQKYFIFILSNHQKKMCATGTWIENCSIGKSTAYFASQIVKHLPNHVLFVSSVAM